MTYEFDPIGQLEHELAIDEATLAADSLGILAEAETRKAAAHKAEAQATNDPERLAAYLSGERASLDAVKAMSAASRMSWELGKIIDSTKN